MDMFKKNKTQGVAALSVGAEILEPPKHVAIIMDGNNRWAKKRGLPGPAGHKVGAENVRVVVDACKELGVEVVTLFAFSTENWQRPEKEVGALMSLFLTYLKNEAKKLKKNNVRLLVIGQRDRFSEKLQKLMAEVEELTAEGTDQTLVLAADYGGKWDLAQATKKIAERVALGELKSEDITEATLQQHICLGDLPPVDLMIRTGGEERISNFMLWQCAYAELYFSDCYWPDFNADQLQKAVDEFHLRQRRFGKTGDQIEEDAKGA